VVAVDGGLVVNSLLVEYKKALVQDAICELVELLSACLLYIKDQLGLLLLQSFSYCI